MANIKPIDAWSEAGGQSISIPLGELVAPGTPNSTKQPAPETRPERGPLLPAPAVAPGHGLGSKGGKR